jgi:nitrate reductase assembly molybdenum cofactor insertion protein NarJ
MEGPNFATGRPVRNAVTRGITYEVLARSFAFPEPASIERMHQMAALALAVDLSPSIRELAEEAARAMADSLMPDYVATFTVVTSPDCPTFESAYVCTDGGQQTSVMADVSGFYRAFGLELAAHVRPDEISAELEFVGYLCRKEAYAAERLGRDVARRAPPGSFYALLGPALARWVLNDLRLLRVDDVERVAGPRMPWQTGRHDPAWGPGSSTYPGIPPRDGR